MTLQIHQMLDTRVQVAAAPAFSRVSITMTDTSGQSVEIALDMEAWIEVAQWMDHGEMHLEEERLQRHRVALDRRLRREERQRWWLGRAASVAIVVAIAAFAVTTVLVLWFGVAPHAHP